MYRSLAAAALVCAVATPTLASELSVRFAESAPKDRFVVKNTGACALDAVGLTLDLDGSAGGLIFDTAGGGAGVEVFQPVEIASVSGAKVTLMDVEDGDTRMYLSLTDVAPGAEVVVTIDVDDTVKVSDLGQIRVTGGEIAGARILNDAGSEATFGKDARAVLQLDDCVS